jgi:hypothetical protein
MHDGHAVDLLWAARPAGRGELRGICGFCGSRLRHTFVDLAMSALCQAHISRVLFENIRRKLPSFACEWTGRKGARELRQILERIGFGLQRSGHLAASTYREAAVERCSNGFLLSAIRGAPGASG